MRSGEAGGEPRLFRWAFSSIFLAMAFIHASSDDQWHSLSDVLDCAGLVCATMNDVSHVTSAESNHMAPHVVSSSTAPRLAIALRTSFLRTPRRLEAGRPWREELRRLRWSHAVPVGGRGKGIVTREAEAKFKRKGKAQARRQGRGAGEVQARVGRDRPEIEERPTGR